MFVSQGGEAHEKQTAQRTVRLLLCAARAPGAEVGNRGVSPGAHRSIGKAGTQTGTPDHRCQGPHRGGYIHRQLHLWI